MSVNTPQPTGDARIVARGFQRYDGQRAGVAGAIRSVMWQSIKATLGLGRSAKHKIFPVAAVVIAYVPAIVFIGLAVLIPSGIVDGPTYPEYYGFVVSAIVLFAALVAPEVLVADRRNGMLAMYLSTPLHRGTYLVAKLLAVALTLSLVTLGPPFIVLLGYTFDGSGPDGFGNWVVVLLRIVLSGVAVSAALTAISMAAACLTDRRAFASIGVVLLVLASPILASALVDGGGLSENWYLLDVFSMPFELVFRIFGDVGGYPTLSTVAVVAVNVGWTVAGFAVVGWRYSRLVIAR